MKLPPPGDPPQFGDESSSLCTFEVHVGCGYSVIVYADSEEEAARIAAENGYTCYAIDCTAGDDEDYQ